MTRTVPKSCERSAPGPARSSPIADPGSRRAIHVGVRFLLVGLIAACAAPQEPGWQWPGIVHAMRDSAPSAVARPDEPRADATTGAGPRIVPETERLRLAVVDLDNDVADALDRLADALAVVAPSRRDDIRIVREAAAEHRAFPRTSLRSAWICGALDAAVRTLSSREGHGAYEAALADVSSATAAIDPAKPTRLQMPAIRTALNKMVGAIAIATGPGSANTLEVRQLTVRNRAHRS